MFCFTADPLSIIYFTSNLQIIYFFIKLIYLFATHISMVRLAGRQDLFVVVRLLAPEHGYQFTNPEKSPLVIHRLNDIKPCSPEILQQAFDTNSHGSESLVIAWDFMNHEIRVEEFS